MKHNRPAAGGVECKAAGSGFAEDLLLFVNYIIAFDCPRPVRQFGDDIFPGLVRAENIFMLRPAEAAKVAMQMRKYASIGRHFPERDIVVDNLAQVFKIVGGSVLGRIETAFEILAELAAGLFTGRTVAAAEKRSEIRLYSVVLGMSVALALVA